MKDTPTQHQSTLPPGERQALVARVLASTQFSRSTRLRDFLMYITERGIADPDAPIHEPEIALQVFGRSTSQGGEDTIVRVHASQLRKRLEQYFLADGATETTVIEIPKGNYTPVFLAREVAAEEPAVKLEGDAIAPPAASASSRLRAPWKIAAVAALLLCAGWLVWDDVRLRADHAPALAPYVSLFWSPFLNSSLNFDIVMADSAFGFLQDLSGVDVSAEQYANRDYQKLLDAIPAGDGLRESASKLTHRRYTSVGDADLARSISWLANSRSDRLLILHARDFQPMRLKTDNVVLIGGKRSDPWAELFENQMNFQYTYDGPRAFTVIRNLKPRPGEKAVYPAEEASERRIPEGFCIIARLPNLSGNGKAMLIAGTETEATEAGGEFVLGDASLAQLHRALGLHAGQPFPDFEALLGTSRVGGASPSARLIAVRRH
jgi:hypothetical protein